MSRGWELRAALVPLQATAPEAKRAKARLVREFSNMWDGGDPTSDDALAWSLANDLLGLPSPVRAEDAEAEADDPEPQAALPGEKDFARAPGDLASWLAVAEGNFATFGLVEAMLGKTDAELLDGARALPVQSAALASEIEVMHARWQAHADALRALFIRMRLAELRRDQPVEA